MEMTHFGSGIWSYSARTTGAIFLVTVPATNIRSACRGDARCRPPNRSDMSQRGIIAAIISIPQQARPNCSHHSEERRAQLNTKSRLVTKTFLSNRLSISPIAHSRHKPLLADSRDAPQPARPPTIGRPSRPIRDIRRIRKGPRTQRLEHIGADRSVAALIAAIRHVRPPSCLTAHTRPAHPPLDRIARRDA